MKKNREIFAILGVVAVSFAMIGVAFTVAGSGGRGNRKAGLHQRLAVEAHTQSGFRNDYNDYAETARLKSIAAYVPATKTSPDLPAWSEVGLRPEKGFLQVAPPPAERDTASGEVSPSATWQTILSDDFEGPWYWATAGSPTWGDTSYRSNTGGWSAFCAEDGRGAPGPYVPNMYAWMTYGPFDLSDATDAQVTFYFWLDSKKNSDWFFWGGSGDGTNFVGYQDSGRDRTWSSVTFSLNDYLGDPSAWFAFVFESNDRIQYEGAYVDDVIIEKYAAVSSGEIHGSKWHDLDADGVWDTEEPGLENWKIYLDENSNGQWDSGEPYELTDANGDYSFTNLPAGTYAVAEEPQNGWDQTFPAAAPLQAQIDRLVSAITTTGSDVPIYVHGEVVPPQTGQITPLTAQSGSLINMDDFRSDPRFAGIDGSGYAAVILDTGIDLDHPFFGPDSDADGVADRIVYHYDFADSDSDASDYHGHGSNVSSIVASLDGTYTGMAPGVDIIHLKVFTDAGAGEFSYVEEALQWVVANAVAYNIVSLNMSLSDTENWGTATSLYGIGDELAALAAMDVIVVSASGNDFFEFGSAQGVGYPSADPNSLSVGAVYDADTGGWTYGSGAKAFSSGPDRITPFSQRHSTLTTIFAPGAPITGANTSGGTVTMHGTSQASPHIAGIAALAQQMAEATLGRRLTVAEFVGLLRSTGVTINDGDDEDDNVANTGLDFPRVDMLGLGEAILQMGLTGVHTVALASGQVVQNIDFGNRYCQVPTITQSPQDVTVVSISNPADAIFTVAATGAEPLHYQWQKNGANIGGDSPTLILPSVQLSDNGSAIQCVVSNACGSDSSSIATLTVLLGGDTNLDGRVDVVDLGTLAGNYGTTSGATWAMGDFNGDGSVDLIDLGTLAGNYGYGTN